MTAGIYAIQDLRTQLIIYIGKSNNIERRWMLHKCPSQAKRFKIDTHIQSQGIANFMWILLSTDNTREAEDEFILKYDTITTGFNQRRSGNIKKKDINGYQRNREKSEKRREYQRAYQKTEKYRKYQREYRREYRRKKTELKQNTDINISND